MRALTLDDLVTSGPARGATGGFPYPHRSVAEIEAEGQPSRWCSQCDRRVTALEAARCRSTWCSEKLAA